MITGLFLNMPKMKLTLTVESKLKLITFSLVSEGELCMEDFSQFVFMDCVFCSELRVIWKIEGASFQSAYLSLFNNIGIHQTFMAEAFSDSDLDKICELEIKLKENGFL